jgi:hypothetical protein
MQLKNPSLAKLAFKSTADHSAAGNFHGPTIERLFVFGGTFRWWGALCFVFAVIKGHILNGPIKRESPIRTSGFEKAKGGVQ